MDPFVGEIRLVGFSFAPVGWALCDGRDMPIAQNQFGAGIIRFGPGHMLPSLSGRLLPGPPHDPAQTSCGPGSGLLASANGLSRGIPYCPFAEFLPSGWIERF